MTDKEIHEKIIEMDMMKQQLINVPKHLIVVFFPVTCIHDTDQAMDMKLFQVV